MWYTIYSVNLAFWKGRKNHTYNIQILILAQTGIPRLIDVRKNNRNSENNLHDGRDVTDLTGELFSVTLQGPPRQTHFGVGEAAILVALCWSEGQNKVNKPHLAHTALLSRALPVWPQPCSSLMTEEGDKTEHFAENIPFQLSLILLPAVSSTGALPRAEHPRSLTFAGAPQEQRQEPQQGDQDHALAAAATHSLSTHSCAPVSACLLLCQPWRTSTCL